jgi:hypothetical protein
MLVQTTGAVVPYFEWKRFFIDPLKSQSLEQGNRVRKNKQGITIDRQCFLNSSPH